MALDPAYSPDTPSTSEAKTSDITELLKSDIINPLINQKETAPTDSGADNTGQ